MRATLSCALLFVAALASADASAHTFTASPPDPTAGEELLLSVDMAFGSSVKSLVSAEARVDGVQIIVTATIAGPDFAVGSSVHAAVATPGLEAGAYEVFLVVRQVVAGTSDLVISPPVFLGRVFVASSAAATPLYSGLNGNWFDTGSPGWGANIVQGISRALFAGWFDYEPRFSSDATFADPQDGTWRVMTSGKWITPTLFRGVVYTTRGTPSNLAWNPASLQVAAAGYLTLTFSSGTQALFEAQSFVSRPAGLAQHFQRRATIRRFQF